MHISSLFQLPAAAVAKPRSPWPRGLYRIVDGLSSRHGGQRRLKLLPELALVRDPQDPGAEKFRQLRFELDSLRDRPTIVAITSAHAGDGRSSLAANLALTYQAECRGSVLLVDADFRRPWMHRFVSPASELGLTHILRGDATQDDAILEIKNSALHVLHAGEIPADPLATLCSPEFEDLLDNLRSSFDRVVIDTPPLLSFKDARVVASKADGAVVVVRTGANTKQSYLEALSQLRGARVLGTVLNVGRPCLADGALPAGRLLDEPRRPAPAAVLPSMALRRSD